MKKIKKIAGVTLGAMLAVSTFASGNFAPLSALEGVAEETGSVETPLTETQSDEMAAYLFVHFVGEGDANGEQIYFSVSRNGTDWETLNEKSPVLTTTLGTKGVRDPNIIRSPDGKFYLIATDLSIYALRGMGNDKWGYSQTDGSKSIVIWESTDLVNWSEPRLKEIARPDAGCAWAPECIWDSQREAYMVFWASKTQDSWTHRIYRCYTDDFDTFTKPELYIESDVSWIDTTFIEHDGVYYRFTKNEDKKYVFMEKSTSINGDFELVSTYSLNGNSASEMTGYEGPTVYKLNGQDKWCLLLDNYGAGTGYKPFVTDDISKGKFVSGDNFNFNDSTFRHGTVLPITLSEYNALKAKWPVETSETGELVFALDFNSENLTATQGNATVTANGGELDYGEGVNGGRAVQLKDNKYISITGNASAVSPLKGLTSFTVSFAAKVAGKSWLFFAAPNTNEQKFESEKYIGALCNGGRLECERYYSDRQSRPTAVSGGSLTSEEWKHVTLVYHANSTILYINGVRVGNVASSVNLQTMLGSDPVIQLGKANWGTGGEFANAWLDEFRIHNYALSSDEVESNYKAVMGIS